MSADDRPPADAARRTALVLQLVPYLITHGEVPVTVAAADFGVPPERLRAVVRSLTTIGLPGEDGYWQMPNDLFDIDWDLLERDDVIALTNVVGLSDTPRLTAREAAALVAGLQLVRSLPGAADDGLIAGLLAKLARGVSATPADIVIAPEPVDGVRLLVHEAIRRGVAVSFTYRAPDAPATVRTVDPAGVVIADGQWYLQGWCHLRRAMRTFHLDRVTDPALTGIPLTHVHEPVPALFEPGSDDDVAVVRFPAAAAPLLGGYLDGADVVADGDDRVARIRVAGPQSLKRLVTGSGGIVRIVAPEAARAAVADWARAALRQYDAPV